MSSTREELKNYFKEVKHDIPEDIFNWLVMVFVTFLTTAQRMWIDMVKLPRWTEPELLKLFDEYKDELKRSIGKN